MKKLYIICIVFLCTTVAYSQLIGEGDTLWAKSGLPTIRQVQFSPDGTKLGVLAYGGDYIGRFFMYDANTGEELWAFTKATYYFNQFSYSLDGSKIYVLPPSDEKINIIDINTGEILDTLPVEISLKMKENEVGNYSSVYQTKNPNILLIGNLSGCYALYDISKRQIIRERYGDYHNRFYASPNSDYFIDASSYYDDDWIVQLVMIDVNTLSTVVILGEEENAGFEGGDIKISYNGKYAATNHGTRALQIWDLDNRKLFKEYSPTIPTETTSGGGPQYALAFCHDNEMIINSGGHYKQPNQPSSATITNFINDKRAILQEIASFRSLDVNNEDTKLASALGSILVVLNLRKDAVPVRETPSEIDSIIYPNPTTGNILVNIPESIGLINKGQLFDNTGKIVKNYLPHELQTINSKLILNINDLNNGFYLLKLSNSNNVLTYKIILEK